MATKATYLWITGRVQGVGYRAWLSREAGRRGLSGWVRNRESGAVEAVLSGEAAVVDAAVDSCRSGPPGAFVRDVVVHSVPEEAGPFAILPTL